MFHHGGGFGGHGGWGGHGWHGGGHWGGGGWGHPGPAFHGRHWAFHPGLGWGWWPLGLGALATGAVLGSMAASPPPPTTVYIPQQQPVYVPVPQPVPMPMPASPQPQQPQPYPSMPVRPPPLFHANARCIKEFVASHESEMTIKKGEILEIISESPTGWTFVKNSAGASGWVPATFYEIIREQQQ